MADIQLNKQEFDNQMLMCRGCEQFLLNTSIAHPQSSSSSQAMDAFMQKLTEVGVLISQYKTVLSQDLSALETVKQEIVSADATSAQNFSG